MITLQAILLLLPATIFGSVGSLFLKKGAEKFTLDISKIKDNFTAFFGFFLFGLSTIFYMYALKFGDLSIVYSLTSFSYILIAFMSIKFLGEKMNKFKWMGVFLIVLGSIIVAS